MAPRSATRVSGLLIATVRHCTRELICASTPQRRQTASLPEYCPPRREHRSCSRGKKGGVNPRYSGQLLSACL
ncbi:hypothetical protein FA95DRAFT_1373552 [Auriscalpium vulgare]|uniref:Uncharacterized protein n=1 Tax=Auriscalpium vulgare TaxID=40419 RepID=A0ACB8R145_9AGAM|nr:hypothetical protein FA95DRAFT_1373552 [Auriscalpium vulgare]